jgi:hypothetical protein
MNIEFSQKFYLALVAVVVVSFAAALFLPVSQTFKGVASLPGTGALAAVAFHMLRDKIEYEREKELQRKQQFFNLGVTSHMAGVAFDKHVEFCEKYIAQMDEGLGQLFLEGPTGEAFSLAGKLSKIRSEFRAWLTEDIVERLLPYEKALTEIGASARLEEHLPVGEKRTRVIDKMFEVFSVVTGIKKEEGSVNKDIAHETIINHLQTVLGIQELTELRQKVMKEAIASIS